MTKKLTKKKRKPPTIDKGLLPTAEDIPPALTPDGVALAPPPDGDTPHGETPETMHIDDLQRAVMGAGYTFKKYNRTHYAVSLPQGPDTAGDADLVDYVRMPWRSALVEVMHKHILKDAKA